VSWNTVTLGDVISLQNGYAFKSSEYSEEGYFLMRITNVQQGFIQNNNPKFVRIPINSKLEQFILNEGDILISLTGDVGRVGILKEENLPAALNQRVARVTIKSSLKLDKSYLFNLLNSEEIRRKIESHGHGAAQLNVSTKDILSIEIPLPPIATQQKIVVKLDAIFAEIDKATVAAEANAKNAEALFQSYLTEIFERGGDGWNSYSLKQLGKVVTGNTPKTSEADNYGDFISFVKPGDFMVDGSIDFEKQKLSEVGMNKSRVVGERSALMVCIGATIGKCGYTDVEIVTNQQINSITPTSNFSHKFIYYQMLTHDFQNSVMDGSGQATLPIINKSKWEALQMKCPSLVEQIEIVKKFDNLRIQTQTLKSGLINKIKQLTLLKKSILQQAFNGELVKD